MFEQALEFIKRHDTIIIHRHQNPDGDALGSQIGLKHLILDNYPQKKVYAVGDESRRFSFMEDSTMDRIDDCIYQKALAIILDTSSSALISDQRYRLAQESIRIDHHIFCEKIAQLEIVDTASESCCGLIAQFARECGLKLSRTSATSIYTGMVTDSGRFRYDNVSSRTFENAAFLMQQKIDTQSIFSNLYTEKYESMKLRAQYVLKTKFTENNVAYIYTTLDEARQSGADTFTLSRGMVNCMSDIIGVDIWVNFTETEENTVLCELRSSRFNINPIAVKYGGGGHAKASGATLTSRTQAMAMLEELDRLSEKGEGK